jgi:hypothetical protein
MKKNVILAALIIIISSAAFSQEPDSLKNNTRSKENNEPKKHSEEREFQTLLGHNRPGGGYGSFSMGYSVIDKKDAVLFGGRFAWIASHSVAFGFGGMGFMNEFHYEPKVDRDVALAGGYGGLYLEPILMPRFPVHLSFPTLFGAGGISYVSKSMIHDNNNLIEDSEAFLVVEPGAELELNLTRYFRFSMGAFYRYTTPFNIGSSGTLLTGTESLKGMSYMLTFKFGKF